MTPSRCRSLTTGEELRHASTSSLPALQRPPTHKLRPSLASSCRGDAYVGTTSISSSLNLASRHVGAMLAKCLTECCPIQRIRLASFTASSAHVAKLLNHDASLSAHMAKPPTYHATWAIPPCETRLGGYLNRIKFRVLDNRFYSSEYVRVVIWTFFIFL